MRTMILSILILYTLWGTTPAISQLPLEVQADAYMLEVELAIGDGKLRSSVGTGSRTSFACSRTTTSISRSSTSGTPKLQAR